MTSAVPASAAGVSAGATAAGRRGRRSRRARAGRRGTSPPCRSRVRRFRPRHRRRASLSGARIGSGSGAGGSGAGGSGAVGSGAGGSGAGGSGAGGSGAGGSGAVGFGAGGSGAGGFGARLRRSAPRAGGTSVSTTSVVGPTRFWRSPVWAGAAITRHASTGAARAHPKRKPAAINRTRRKSASAGPPCKWASANSRRKS